MNTWCRSLLTLIAVVVMTAPVTLAYENESDGTGATAGKASSGQESHYEDPCAEAHATLEDEIEEIHARYIAEHQALDDEAKRFYAENHTEDERRAFEEEQSDARDRLMDQEVEELEAAQHRFEERCESEAPGKERPGHATGEGHEAPPEWVSDECRDAMRKMQAAEAAHWDEIHDEIQKRWEAFEAEIRAEWDAFHAEGNHTEEEFKAFEARMEERREAFRVEMAAYEAEHYKTAKGRADEVHKKVSEACRPMHAGPTGDASEVPAEIAALHEECRAKAERLEAQMEAELRAMEEAWDGNGSDHKDFDKKMRAHHEAFEKRMRTVMRECEERARELWESHHETLEAEEADRMGSWSFSQSNGTILVTGRYMSLQGDPSTNTIGQIAVAGETFIAHIDSLGRLELFDMEETRDGDSTITATGEGLRLRLHDNPAGVINLKADPEAAYLLRIPASIEVNKSANGWSLAGADGTAMLRARDDASIWDAETRILKVWGEATFLVKDKADNAVLPKVANKHRDAITEAVETRRLGAEITVAKDADGKSKGDSVVYDGDVEVAVETDDGTTADAAPVTVTVSSDILQEGRTFVVNIDEAIVGSGVAVQYFDVDETTGAETPQDIRRASSLADILDATNDDGAEYWIVVDDDGVQLMVSVPHWSTHRFRVYADDSTTEPVPMPGALAVLLAVGALALVARRRR